MARDRKKLRDIKPTETMGKRVWGWLGRPDAARVGKEQSPSQWKQMLEELQTANKAIDEGRCPCCGGYLQASFLTISECRSCQFRITIIPMTAPPDPRPAFNRRPKTDPLVRR